MPASLSTSVFGMNLRELGSPPVWVFVVTSLAIFAGAFSLWVAVYEFNLAIHIPRARELEGVSLPHRLYLLAWLISHFHVIYFFRSGIWLSLLTDGHIGFIGTCNDPTCSRVYPSSHGSNRPVEYIWRHKGRFGRQRSQSGFRGIYWNHG